MDIAPEMDNAPEGEQLKLNFTVVVQNFISKKPEMVNAPEGLKIFYVQFEYSRDWIDSWRACYEMRF